MRDPPPTDSASSTALPPSPTVHAAPPPSPRAVQQVATTTTPPSPVLVDAIDGTLPATRPDDVTPNGGGDESATLTSRLNNSAAHPADQVSPTRPDPHGDTPTSELDAPRLALDDADSSRRGRPPFGLGVTTRSKVQPTIEGVQGAVLDDDAELQPPRPFASSRRDSSTSSSGFSPVDVADPLPSTSSSPKHRSSNSTRNKEQRPPALDKSTPSAATDAQPQKTPVPSPTSPRHPPAATPSRLQRSDPNQGPPVPPHNATPSSTSRSRRQLGEYAMGKTLGAGSMGKVKLGVSAVTGEKIAIKIIPRHTSVAAAQAQASAAVAHQVEKERKAAANGGGGGGGTSPNVNGEGEGEKKQHHKHGKEEVPVAPSPSFIAKAHAKDVSKEIRTIREASIVLLLHHPYICGMKSMLVYPHHYYMLTEYVNGGQMLDYIISHGRLRERAARKFARQMGSALEYCHANSIVHRDLKIENILISKTGNIKIIDFGLSNLYSPHSHLSTFCGSLYFAAPELLNAKVYTGPEVDVWSLGIVLYVLVCGKVPFDDQSMPALHAKIKRGQVEYPAWLSPECRSLLSRMLVTSPSARASLSEILKHPWMVKNYEGPPDPHLPHREALREQDLDAEVIRGMTGFEFGTPKEVTQRLREILTSELYLTVLKLVDAKKGQMSNGAEVSANGVKKENKGDRDLPRAGRSPSRRFSGIGFYSKKVAGGFAAVLGGGKENDRSSDGVTSGMGSDVQLANGTRIDTLDPTRGFHPLLSVYFLVREKMEREKVYGPGVFASSTLSLNGPPPPPAPPSAYRSSLSPVTPEFPSIPSPTMSTMTQRTNVPSSVSTPRRSGVPFSATMSPTLRTRASGEEHALRGESSLTGQGSVVPTKIVLPGTTASAPPTPAAVGTSSFARQSLLDNDRNKPMKAASHRRSVHIMNYMTDSESNANAKMERRSSTELEEELSRPQSATTTGTFARRFGSLLGRSSSMADSDYKRHRHRSSIGGTGHKAGTKTPVAALPQVNEAAGTSVEQQGNGNGGEEGEDDVPLARPDKSQGVGRALTLGSPPASTGGGSRNHTRGASVGGNATSSIGRSGTTSAINGTGNSATLTVSSAGVGRQRMTSLQNGFSGASENVADGNSNRDDGRASLAEARQNMPPVTFTGRSPAPNGKEKIKPVYLKGLFSVATTSTRSASALKRDLANTLDRIGIQHRDIEGGFECAHVPSIDLTSISSSARAQIGGGDSGGGLLSSKRRGSLRPKVSTSKLQPQSPPLVPSQTVVEQQQEQSDTSLPHSATVVASGSGVPRTTSSSSFAGRAQSILTNTGIGGGVVETSPPKSPHKTTTTTTTSQSQASLMKIDLIVRFEIFLVKMPLLPGILGVQFRRISGDAWQYQTFARRILQELKP